MGIDTTELSQPLSRRIPVAFAAILISGCLYLFWPLLFSGHQLSYRDASYLYYPLFSYIQSEWESGTLPLWNPYCGLGQPLLADGSSSIFYPGKLVFFANFLSFSSRFGVFVCMHVLLCGWGAYACARRFGVSQFGSAICGLTFAFGAPVLSQANNVVYLVGVTWLPWAVLCILRLNQKNGDPVGTVWERIRNVGFLGTTWAMMILGGDAQMAYHSFMFAIMMAGVGTLAPNRFRQFPGYIASIASAAVVAFLLSAIQILPSSQAMQQSVRQQFELPRSIYEIPTYLERKDSSFGEAIEGVVQSPWGKINNPSASISHHSDLYQFSLPPWALGELLAPNLSGKAYPHHHRWADHLEILPEKNRRSWFPSLYMGSVGLVLAFFGTRWFRPKSDIEQKRARLSWIAVWFCVGAFGIFGPGMLFNCIVGGESNSAIGPQVGGPYWLMNVFLPKYVMFRYPAKLFMVVGFCISILAGFGLDRLLNNENQRRLKLLVSTFGLFLVATLMILFVWEAKILTVLESCAPDEVLGVFDSAGALGDIRFGLFQSLIALVVLLLMIGWFSTNSPRSLLRRDAFKIGYLFCFVLELLLANGWIINTIRPPDLPVSAGAGWNDGRDESPMAQFVHQQYNNAEPKFHLLTRTSRLDSFSSIERADWAYFIQETNKSSPVVLDMLEGQNAVWIAKRIRRVPPLGANTPTETYGRTQQVLNSIDKVTLVETDDSFNLESYDPNPAVMERLVRSSNRLEFEVTLDARSFLVVNEQYDQGWTAQIQSAESSDWAAIPIYRTNRVMRGIMLPDGIHNVRFEYCPQSYVFGAWTSLLGWATLLITGFLMSFRMFFRTRRGAERKT